MYRDEGIFWEDDEGGFCVLCLDCVVNDIGNYADEEE